VGILAAFPLGLIRCFVFVGSWKAENSGFLRFMAHPATPYSVSQVGQLT